MFADDYSEWTSCEVHGHVFKEIAPGKYRCTDCGAEYED